MAKEIVLWAATWIDSASIIGVRLNGEEKFTKFAVRQGGDRTIVWNYESGREVYMPCSRYTLSNDEGKKKFSEDLDMMGLIGFHYTVQEAVTHAEPFHTGNDAVDREAMRAYENFIDLGEFLSDEQAIRKLTKIQDQHDYQALKVLVLNGYEDDLGGSGACYVAHLFREKFDGTETQVEVK